MKYLFLILLSCIAATAARADVIATDGAVIVQGRDRGDREEKIQAINNNIRNRDIQIYTNGSSSGQAFIMRNGRLEQLSDGEYQLPSGKKINIKNGRINARFGDRLPDSDIKIIQPNQ